MRHREGMRERERERRGEAVQGGRTAGWSGAKADPLWD